ncbi:bacteriophage abortive infection AbiH family protein [Pseudoalteromonas sp. N1230-9]|uniref:AbiH family protein n=1 Tax=Pseudoalteromonas sp. N1230-9 TaxID=2907156 RepID=UPI002B324EE3|nr:bacteriophage abortive infection AbiH family protein [Pseudoalteromonas sp. N1230-9]
MNVVYLIGNGFDLNLGLKTSYNDFYNFYINKKSTSSIVQKFKNSISSDLSKWADLELELGNYTKSIESLDALDEIHADIVDELADYLDEIQRNFSLNEVSEVSKSNFLQDFFHPEKFLRNRDQISLNNFFTSKSTDSNIFSIISFNYTHTIEHILGIKELANNYKGLDIQEKYERTLNKLFFIHHVHGSLTSNMVLGVNDSTQIANSSLKDDTDAKNQLVKRDCNLVMKHGVEIDCTHRLTHADLICIFGSSIGQTDQIWWDLIETQLIKRDCRLIIFDRVFDISSRRSHLFNRREREVLQKFIKSVDIDTISSKVYFAFNSEIFRLSDKL